MKDTGSKNCSGSGRRKKQNSLMQVASEHIAPLQDAVDLEIATEKETLLLEAGKSIGCC
ncbi:tail fiber assembly protein [Escherichia coli]|uniref:tail fiber assembly protein n=1 Tax=Escherichia coli TaxID=562 RepID=UPI00388FF076